MAVSLQCFKQRWRVYDEVSRQERCLDCFLSLPAEAQERGSEVWFRKGIIEIGMLPLDAGQVSVLTNLPEWFASYNGTLLACNVTFWNIYDEPFPDFEE